MNDQIGSLMDFVLEQTVTGTHWIGGWVGSGAGLDAVAKRQISILAGIRTLVTLPITSLGQGGPASQIFRLTFIVKFIIKLKYVRNPWGGGVQSFRLCGSFFSNDNNQKSTSRNNS
jgi:hypothetical protein